LAIGAEKNRGSVPARLGDTGRFKDKSCLVLIGDALAIGG
jgi:hypothetical protein